MSWHARQGIDRTGVGAVSARMRSRRSVSRCRMPSSHGFTIVALKPSAARGR